MVNEQWIGKSTCNYCGHQFTARGSHLRAKKPYFFLCIACYYNSTTDSLYWKCYQPDPNIPPPDPQEAMTRLRALLNGDSG